MEPHESTRHKPSFSQEPPADLPEAGLGNWQIPNALHHRTAARPSVTESGASRFGVSPERFCDWRWQIKRQLRNAEDSSPHYALSETDLRAFAELDEAFQAGITPYYAALANRDNPECPIRLQSLPDAREASDRLGVADPLAEVSNSPVPEVVHVYPDRVAFCVAQLCPVYCRYCFRKRRDNQDGLHFNPRILQTGLHYIRSNPSIRDVLLTGGDPLVAHDEQILKLVRALRDIPHVEIIRIGTRTPVTLPYRITAHLARDLAKHHPVWINTHFNCVEEITPEAAAAVDVLLREGIPVGNQSVLLAGVNDSYEKMKDLLQGLVRIRVRPYYLYHPQIVEGTEHLRVPLEKGLDIMRALRGQTTGFAIPAYILDTPHGKVPLNPSAVLGRQGDHVVIRTNQGSIWKEPSPLGGYQSSYPLPPSTHLEG